MNLGIVKASLKKSAEAERCYFTAMKHRRKYPDCLYNLGNLVSTAEPEWLEYHWDHGTLLEIWIVRATEG